MKRYDRVMPRVYNRSRSSLKSTSFVTRHQTSPSGVLGSKPSVSCVSSGVFSDLPVVLNDYKLESGKPRRPFVVKPRKTLKSLDPALSPPRSVRRSQELRPKPHMIKSRGSAPTVMGPTDEQWPETHMRQCLSSRSHTILKDLKDEIKSYEEQEKMVKLRRDLFKSCGVMLDNTGQLAADKAVQVEVEANTASNLVVAMSKIRRNKELEVRLIAAVRARRPLWDPTTPLHKSVKVLIHLWAQVAKELHMDVLTVKRKWKSLRDYFFRQMRDLEVFRVKKGRNGTGDVTQYKYCLWPLYEKLSFLENSFKERRKRLQMSDNDFKILDELTGLNSNADENGMETIIYHVPNSEQAQASDADSDECELVSVETVKKIPTPPPAVPTSSKLNASMLQYLPPPLQKIGPAAKQRVIQVKEFDSQQALKAKFQDNPQTETQNKEKSQLETETQQEDLSNQRAENQQQNQNTYQTQNEQKFHRNSLSESQLTMQSKPQSLTQINTQSNLQSQPQQICLSNSLNQQKPLLKEMQQLGMNPTVKLVKLTRQQLTQIQQLPIRQQTQQQLTTQMPTEQEQLTQQQQLSKPQLVEHNQLTNPELTQQQQLNNPLLAQKQFTNPQHKQEQAKPLHLTEQTKIIKLNQSSNLQLPKQQLTEKQPQLQTQQQLTTHQQTEQQLAQPLRTQQLQIPQQRAQQQPITQPHQQTQAQHGIQMVTPSNLNLYQNPSLTALLTSDPPPLCKIPPLKKIKLTPTNEKKDSPAPGCSRKDNEDDADFQFFKSLIPFMKEFPLKHRMQVRNSIQQLILKELELLEKNKNLEDSSNKQSPSVVSSHVDLTCSDKPHFPMVVSVIKEEFFDTMDCTDELDEVKREFPA